MARLMELGRFGRVDLVRAIRHPGSLSGANLALLLAVGAVLLPYQLHDCWLAAREVLSATETAPRTLSGLLNQLVVAWLVIPYLAIGLNVAEGGVSLAKLARFPLRPDQLLLVAALTTIANPAYWLLTLASLGSLAPFLLVPHPAAALACAVALIAAAVVLSWAITLLGAQALQSPRAADALRATVLGLGLSCVALVAHAFLAGNTPNPESSRLGVSLPAFDLGSMASAAGYGHEGWGFAMLATIGVGTLALLAALAGARRTAMSRAAVSARARKSAIHGCRGSTGFGVTTALLQKEWRYVSRSLDALFAAFLSVLAASFLAIDHSPLVALVFGCALITGTAAIPLNCFGTDQSAVNRYRLLPVRGVQVLVSKNLAYFALVALSALPVGLSASIAISGFLGASIVLALLTAAVVAVSIGNRVSITSASPRQLFSFDTHSQMGGAIASAAAWVAVGLPASLSLLFDCRGGTHLMAQTTLLAIALSLYRARIQADGDRFEDSSELLDRCLRLSS